VLNAQAVEFAKERGIALFARSSHGGSGETIVRTAAPRGAGRVVGVTSETGLVLLSAGAGGPRLLESLVGCLHDGAFGGKQLLFEDSPGDGHVSLVLSLENLHDFPRLKQELGRRFGESVRLREGVGAVSAIGAGINAGFDNLRRCLGTLASIPASVIGLSTSSFRISVLLAEAHVAEAVRQLHRELVTGPAS